MVVGAGKILSDSLVAVRVCFLPGSEVKEVEGAVVIGKGQGGMGRIIYP